jgi:hypothetical protein
MIKAVLAVTGKNQLVDDPGDLFAKFVGMHDLGFALGVVYDFF